MFYTTSNMAFDCTSDRFSSSNFQISI